MNAKRLKQFATICNLNPEELNRSQLKFGWRSKHTFGFTNTGAYLGLDQKVTLRLDPNSPEPQIIVVKDEPGFTIGQGTVIIYMVPEQGQNQTKVWVTEQEVQILTDKVRDTKIVRIRRETYRDSKLVHKGIVHFRTMFLDHLMHLDFAENFQNLEVPDGAGYTYKFTFEIRKGFGDEWKSITDPRHQAVRQTVAQPALVAAEVKVEEPVVVAEAKVEKPKAKRVRTAKPAKPVVGKAGAKEAEELPLSQRVRRRAPRISDLKEVAA